MSKLIFKKKSKGYALLFTMVVVSVMLAIAAGIASNISKQLVLSSTALDSQIAFYEADTAGECMLYASEVALMPVLASGTPPQFTCGGLVLDITINSFGVYSLVPPFTTKGPAFQFELDESAVPSIGKAYGYNLWQDNNRKVERGIKITY